MKKERVEIKRITRRHKYYMALIIDDKIKEKVAYSKNFNRQYAVTKYNNDNSILPGERRINLTNVCEVSRSRKYRPIKYHPGKKYQYYVIVEVKGEIITARSRLTGRSNANIKATRQESLLNACAIRYANDHGGAYDRDVSDEWAREASLIDEGFVTYEERYV